MNPSSASAGTSNRLISTTGPLCASIRPPQPLLVPGKQQHLVDHHQAGKAPGQARPTGSIERGHTCSEAHPAAGPHARVLRAPPARWSDERAPNHRHHSRRSMPGGEGQPASGTWAQWPLAGADPGGMLTTSASRYQARQAESATQRGMLWLDPTGRFQRGTEARRSTCHPATWPATLTRCACNARSVG
jgi:hypothetical protein